MAETTVLVLSDDADTRQLFQQGLGQRGVTARVADLAAAPIEQHLSEPPDLVIIDVDNALDAALAACRRLRAEVANPILMFIYAHDEREMVQAYEAGADECIAKPIGRRLLIAKIRAWLRRAWNVPATALDALQAGGLQLDPAQRRLQTVSGATIHLTNLEFRLLHLLMSHPGQVFQGSEIIERVWGYDAEQDGALIKHLVYRLRHKMELDPGHPRFLQTAGGGYCFRRPGE